MTTLDVAVGFPAPDEGDEGNEDEDGDGQIADVRPPSPPLKLRNQLRFQRLADMDRLT
jgi:hypothetical protein